MTDTIKTTTENFTVPAPPDHLRPATIADFHIAGVPKAGMTFYIYGYFSKEFEKYTLQPNAKAALLKPYMSRIFIEKETD